MTIELNNLKESNEFLNLLMDNITSAVFLIDKNVRLRQFNNAFKKLFSKEETELINELCGNLIWKNPAITTDYALANQPMFVEKFCHLKFAVPGQNYAIF